MKPVRSVDIRNTVLCMALFAISVAATYPVFEMGFNDDWAYSHMAMDFANTHRIDYNGWPAMILIPQIVWAWPLIKLFGFSFLITRLSTVLLSLLAIPVLYSLARRSGLLPGFAVFVTLLTMLSPLMLPLAISFMSDVPSFVVFVLCLYAGVRAWQAADPKVCVLWGGLCAFSGFLSGLDRQIYWIAPLLFLPVIGVIQRRKRSAVIGLAAAWLAAILGVASSEAWYLSKPLTVSGTGAVDPNQPVISNGDLFFHWAKNAVATAGDSGMYMGVLLFPLLAACLVPVFKKVSRKTALLVLFCAVSIEGAYAALFPERVAFISSLLADCGILRENITVFGERPIILTPEIRFALAVAVLLACGGWALALARDIKAAPGLLRNSPATPALVLGLAFGVPALTAILYRSLDQGVFDRYLLPLLPLCAIPLARYHQSRIRPRLGGLSWAVLAIFALYGIATSHDAFAMIRARAAAARKLEQTGVPRTEISAGFEYDGWTQLEVGGFINNPQIVNPAGSYRQLSCTGYSRPIWYLGLMPVIHARYIVVLSPLLEIEDQPDLDVSYTTWLPPARRQVLVQKLPGTLFAGCM